MPTDITESHEGLLRFAETTAGAELVAEARQQLESISKLPASLRLQLAQVVTYWQERLKHGQRLLAHKFEGELPVVEGGAPEAPAAGYRVGDPHDD